MVIFSDQDVTKDPPFSGLDLIICRNLLIYFNSELQKKLIPLFHYALLKRGILFLGTSEGIGDFEELFSVLDRKWKIFQAKDQQGKTRYNIKSSFGPRHKTIPTIDPREIETIKESPEKTLRELTEQMLLKQIAPVGLVINKQGDILYQYGDISFYVSTVEQEDVPNNIFKLAGEDLGVLLKKAIKKANLTHKSIFSFELNAKNQDSTQVPIFSIHQIQDKVKNLPSDQWPIFLITFEESEPFETMLSPAKKSDLKFRERIKQPLNSKRIKFLERELRSKNQLLHETKKQLESYNEELKSSNEEMQSVNEELQSTNEELETSKEELQSINEELVTTNNELNNNIANLSQLNNDMNNLLSGTGIATIFVDRNLSILRFTPNATVLINLISSDVGRPLAHIVSNIVGYNRLLPDIKLVLASLKPIEHQVQTIEGLYFTMRIRPYRTLEDVIEGVVLTFVDVTESVKKQKELDLERNKLAAALECTNIGFIVFSIAEKETFMNASAMSFFGITNLKDIATRGNDLKNDWEIRYSNGELIDKNDWPDERALRGEMIRDLEIHYFCLKNGIKRIGRVTSMITHDIHGQVSFVVQTIIDITIRP